jgi:hypothetical protein
MKRLLGLFCLTILLTTAGFSKSSYAEKRAFILGINAYDQLDHLTTAVNDSAAVAEALRTVGFSIIRLNDAGSTQFAEKWREFLATLKPGDTAAFYFAGHGFQVDGANYLVLRDTPGPEAGESAVLGGSLNFHELMEQLEARELARTIYILDACRVSPFGSKRAQTLKGQARGLAPIESLFGAFVMYSAGAGEEALDYLVDPAKERNSVYARRLLAMLRNKDLSIGDVATQVRVQVESDANSVKHRQRPAYFDGITGRYYLAAATPDGKPLSTSARIAGNNVIRLGGFATWDTNCQSRPAPRVTATSPPRYGRIITRFETFMIAGAHAGEVSCNQTTQKGVGVYYVVDDAFRSSTAVDSVQLTVRHWSVAPSFSATEMFDVDLATRYSRRVTGR